MQLLRTVRPIKLVTVLFLCEVSSGRRKRVAGIHRRIMRVAMKSQTATGVSTLVLLSMKSPTASDMPTGQPCALSCAAA